METNINYFTNEAELINESVIRPLLFGLLSMHSYHGLNILKKQVLSQVIISDDSEFTKAFREKWNVDVNDLLHGWSVNEVIYDKETGYLGVIYCNEIKSQIVLAHRGTAPSECNLFKHSEKSTDFESILLGRLLPQLTSAYIATKKAVKIANDFHFQFSLTGHSLGSFLAQLSLFYCCSEFNRPYTKAIVFDGPASTELILSFLNNHSIITENKLKLSNFNIDHYLTAPNAVNCCNSQHFGNVFTIYPCWEEEAEQKMEPGLKYKYYHFLVENCFEPFHNYIVSTTPQSLSKALILFNPNTGYPESFKKVLKWPSIISSNFTSKGDVRKKIANLETLSESMIIRKKKC